MSAEASKTEHFSGKGLLEYLKKQGVNINEIPYVGLPPVIHLGEEDMAVSVAVANLLIDDSQGVLARKFSAACPEYEQDVPHTNLPKLIGLVQGFVRDVLIEPSRPRKLKAPTKTQKKEPEQAETNEVEEIYKRIDHAVNRWAEKFTELIPLTEEYVSALCKSYHNPIPENWSDYDYDDDDDGGWSTKVDDERERIPNRHLDMLARILAIFDEKTRILDNRSDQKNPRSKYNTPIKDQLDELLEATIGIKNLSWEIFENYWYNKKGLQSQMEGIIHLINTIQAWLQ